MADRYTYLSTIGLFIMLAWGGVDIVKRLSVPKWAMPGFALSVVCISALVTHNQLLHWQNSETLFAHAAAVTKGNWLAEHNLGLALSNEGKFSEAETHLGKALEITPRNPTVNETRGVNFLNLGKPKLAAECFREVMAIKPDNLDVSRHLAWIYATSEDSELRSGFLAVELARKVCEKAKTTDAGQYDLLAAAYAANGEFANAVAAAKKSCGLAEVAGQDATEIHQRLRLYQAREPYRSRFEPKRSRQFAARQL
jgi:tetratricopeptide (TPR) repeat protein